jgi:hypothetical protein
LQLFQSIAKRVFLISEEFVTAPQQRRERASQQQE